jgi:hypothetical protein
VRAALPPMIALLLGVLAALAVGCGSRSNLIPSGDATNLKAQLAQIKQDVAAGNCSGLETAIQQVHDDAAALPSQVDKRLRSRINDGIQALENTAGTDCRAAKAAQTATQTQTQTTETTPTVTQTQPSETTTTPTTTQPTDTTTAPTTTEPTTTATTPTTPDSGTPSPPADNGGTPGGSVP